MTACSVDKDLQAEMDSKIELRNEHQKQLEVQKLSVWGSIENIEIY